MDYSWMETRSVTTEQKLHLLGYLELNIDLVHSKGINPNENSWNWIAVQLNQLGGKQRNGRKWRRYWAALRYRTERKPFKDLTALEQRIMAITKSPTATIHNMNLTEFDYMHDIPTVPIVPEEIQSLMDQHAWIVQPPFATAAPEMLSQVYNHTPAAVPIRPYTANAQQFVQFNNNGIYAKFLEVQGQLERLKAKQIALEKLKLELCKNIVLSNYN